MPAIGDNVRGVTHREIKIGQTMTLPVRARGSRPHRCGREGQKESDSQLESFAASDTSLRHSGNAILRAVLLHACGVVRKVCCDASAPVGTTFEGTRTTRTARFSHTVSHRARSGCDGYQVFSQFPFVKLKAQVRLEVPHTGSELESP
jgi:hypothetical protein